MSPPRAEIVTEIHPRRGWAALDLREIWRYRDLLWLFSLRDVQVRYKQTVFGVAWAVIQPVMMMVVMTLIFGKGLRLEESSIPGIPYAVAFLAAQIVWSFFANGLNSTANSLVGNAGIVTKVYFPRLIVPIAALSTALVDFLIAFLIFVLVAWAYGVAFTGTAVLLPLVFASMVLAAFGLGLVLAALMVSYRDVRYVIPYCLQVGFFVSPVVWWEEHVGELMGAWKPLLYLNPIAGPLTAFRDIMTGQPLDWLGWFVSITVSVLIACGGAVYFARAEARFADVA